MLDKVLESMKPQPQYTVKRLSEGRTEDAAMRGEDLPSNIDNEKKKPSVGKDEVDRLKSRLAALKVKLSAARKSEKPNENVILGLENEIDVVSGKIDQAK